eukprot:1966649-Rhodomonas_salina.2
MEDDLVLETVPKVAPTPLSATRLLRDVRYHSTRLLCRVRYWHSLSGTVLGSCYAMSGTGGMVLRVCYAMPGTDVGDVQWELSLSELLQRADQVWVAAVRYWHAPRNQRRRHAPGTYCTQTVRSCPLVSQCSVECLSLTLRCPVLAKCRLNPLLVLDATVGTDLAYASTHAVCCVPYWPGVWWCKRGIRCAVAFGTDIAHGATRRCQTGEL